MGTYSKEITCLLLLETWTVLERFPRPFRPNTLVVSRKLEEKDTMEFLEDKAAVRLL